MSKRINLHVAEHLTSGGLPNGNRTFLGQLCCRPMTAARQLEHLDAGWKAYRRLKAAEELAAELAVKGAFSAREGWRK